MIILDDPGGHKKNLKPLYLSRAPPTSSSFQQQPPASCILSPFIYLCLLDTALSKMQYLNLALAFATAVSAIDIVGRGGNHCGGSEMVRWRDTAPDQCYGRSTYSLGLSFVAIPTDWRIRTRSYEREGCQVLVHDFPSNGADNVCHGSSEGLLIFKSGSYTFNGRKRSVKSSNLNTEDCIGPDVVTLADGQAYIVTGLPDETLNAMVSSNENLLIIY